MKKLVILVLLLVMVTGAVAAEQFSIDAGAGLWLNLYPSTGDELIDAILILFGLRGGGYGTFRYNLSDAMSVGGEIGFAYMSASSGESTTTLFDLPINAIFRIGLGGIALQPYAGVLLSGVDSDISVNLNAGAKAMLGIFFADAGYVIGLGDNGFGSYPRFGLGVQFNNLLQF